MMNKVDFNRRMIGKEVCLTNHNPEVKAEILDVVNEESFLVRMMGGQILTVSMYDIRSIENAAEK